MNGRNFLILVLACAGLGSFPAGAGVLSQWVQYRADGVAEIRAVTDGPGCPAATIDGKSVALVERAKPSAGFPAWVCAAPVPRGGLGAEIGGAGLRLPKALPERILLLGDTGCRVKGWNIQACADPVAWPFPGLAAKAAALKPDLVVHVGDYLYRETPCPADHPECAGPSGDNWPSWAADFFIPAAPLLRAAPWIFVRGNHEDCERAWKGWFRLMAPGAEAPVACASHLPPYAIDIGGTQLVVIDDTDAPDRQRADELVPRDRAEFSFLPVPPGARSWLFMHKPPRAVLSLGLGLVAGSNPTLTAALDRGLPPGVELLVAGHIHAFEAMNFDPASALPPQLLVGNGGDKLDTAPGDLAGLEIGGVKIADGMSLPGFGFLLLHREAASWSGEGYDATGALIARCSIAAKRLDCKPL